MERPPPFVLYELATRYYVSQALYVAARLGIADAIGEGTRDARDLARETKTHAPSLERVIRLLVSAGIFEEDSQRRFRLTPVGAFLRSDVPGSMRAAVLLFAGITQRGWSDLEYSVETGKPAFEHVFGMAPFEYFAAHPDEGANFDRAMSDFTSQMAAVVASSYDFSKARRLVDVGGGDGALLRGILRAHSHLDGTVFDLPPVAARAKDDGLGARFHAEGGDFFESVPSGADLYLLKHVIHDWDDERAAAILRSCARAMSGDARVLVIEGLYPERVDGSPESFGATANDVNMLVSTGGRQRSQTEFRSLYEASGLELSRIVETPMPVRLIEGRRA